MASRKQEHIEHITERCLIAQKILFSRNELRDRDWKYCCKRCRRNNRQVREFLFLSCVKKTISMKILVLRVINSPRHRSCFVRGCIHELFVSKALTCTRSYLARSGFHTNNSWIQPRTPHLTFYDVNYLTVILRGRAGYELIYITNEAVGKSEKNNCFSKFSSNSLDFFGWNLLKSWHFLYRRRRERNFFRPPKFQHKKFAISFSLFGQT